jgi:hypothetical protein
MIDSGEGWQGGEELKDRYKKAIIMAVRRS